MPPRKAFRGRPARRNVEEQELPNAPEVQPQGEVTNAEFIEAIKMLSQVVTSQDGQQRGAWHEEVDTSRIQGRAAMLIGDIDISRLMVYVQQVEEEKLRDKDEFKNKRAKTENESGQQKSNANRSSFQQKQKGPAPLYASEPTPKNKCEYNNQNFRAKPAYSQGSVAQGGSKSPACAKCGRKHLGICREGSTGCFKCGQSGHFIREWPKSKQGSGNGGNRA
ncbi:uncharacterized protein LOC125830116 [Solanum verrucosum]|uniref:uncharacterized protein LOC125830116 n=1 Tax=Solanum verrucosum TaxID=315347 RepID=UPI0020D04E26|nr:uncharacterized protein LOC125830116 [Solanum verrucosum]